MTIGVIITTYGNNYVFAKQTLLSFQRHLPFGYIFLYVNGTTDPRLLSIQEEWKNRSDKVEVILCHTPFAGGLTWTWNDGIQRCIAKECSTVILSNDDVIVTGSVHHILDECKTHSDELVYFGPVTNEPGNANNRDQKALAPIDTEPYLCTHKGKPLNINGFFMVFPIFTLIENRFDETHFFDPQCPFGGNEVEWFERFIQRGGKPIVVPRTFIYHYKLKSWRPNTVYKDTCVYTVNMGEYEGGRILLSDAHITPTVDLLYFTDQEELMYACLQKKILPFLLMPNEFGKTPKLLQRTIKSSPHLFLPPQYTTSLYIDGNVELVVRSIQEYPLHLLEQYDLICYAHPRDKLQEKTILFELETIVDKCLATREQTQAVLSEFILENYNPTIPHLTDTKILIRKHQRITEFSEDWTRMIHICPRDQASFDFLRTKHRLRAVQLPVMIRKLNIKKHVNPIHRTLS